MLSDNEGVQWMSEHRFNDFKQVDPFESDTPNAHSHLSPMHHAFQLQGTLDGHVSIRLPRKHLFRSRFGESAVPQLTKMTDLVCRKCDK